MSIYYVDILSVCIYKVLKGFVIFIFFYTPFFNFLLTNYFGCCHPCFIKIYFLVCTKMRGKSTELVFLFLLFFFETSTAAPQHRSGTGRCYSSPSNSIYLYISSKGRFYASPSAVNLYKSGTGRFYATSSAVSLYKSGTGRFYATPSAVSLYKSGTGRFYATPSAVPLYINGTGRFYVFFWKLVQLYLSIKWNRKVSLPAVLLGAESLSISVKGSFMFQLFFLEVKLAVPQCRCGTDVFYMFFLGC